MKIQLSKEKTQYAFMFLAIVTVLVIMVLFGLFYYKGYQKWRGYKKDEGKRVFVEKIDEIKKKKSDDMKGDDYLDLGNSYYNLGEYGAAIGYYKKALETDAKDVAELNLANVYAVNKDYKKSEEYYYIVLKREPNNVTIYKRLADLYKIEWSGKANDEIGTLLEGLKNIPNDIELLVRTAEFYSSNGEKSVALEYYKKALEQDPDNEVLKKEAELMTQP